jgi:murein DD-endopeptidase MepM/ murein hydrolase activator NlpD
MPDEARHATISGGSRTVIRPDWRTELHRERPSRRRPIRDAAALVRDAGRRITRRIMGIDWRGLRQRDWPGEVRGAWFRGREWVLAHRVLVAVVALAGVLTAADGLAPHTVDVTPAPGVAQRIPVPYPLQVQADPETSARDLAAIDNGERLREQAVVGDAARATLARAEAEAAAAAAGQPSPLLGGASTSLPGGIESSTGGYALPARGVFTSGYGPRWGTFHYGIDIAAPIGSPIYAVSDGTVINAGPAEGFGLWVRIRDDDGTISVYGHMYDFSVSVGERVRAGEQIARVGNRGDATGPHLHFEILVNGQHIDPQPWLALHGIKVG